MADMYYVFHLSEDGETHLESLTSEELESRLNEDYYGDDIEKLSDIPDFECDHGLLIIKGQIVVPKAKKTVIKWEVE